MVLWSLIESPNQVRFRRSRPCTYYLTETHTVVELHLTATRLLLTVTLLLQELYNFWP